MSVDPETCEAVSVDTALAIQAILDRHWKVQFWDDDDAQNKVINDIDDYLFDEIKGARGVVIGLEQMDALIEKTLNVSRSRRK